MNRLIFLVGLPGAGKTTMGKQLADELDIPYSDLDEIIINNEQSSISSLFEQHGEAYFRKLEQKYLLDYIEKTNQGILSTGGGAPCFFDNMSEMKQAGITVFINTPIATIKSRLEKDTSRPLMQQHTLEKLAHDRMKWYEQAHYTISSLQDLIRIVKN